MESSRVLTAMPGHNGTARSPSEEGARILDGRAVAAEIRATCAAEIKVMLRRHNILPGLAVVRVGADPASVSYAERIVSAFNKSGLNATVFELPARASRSLLQAELDRL